MPTWCPNTLTHHFSFLIAMRLIQPAVIDHTPHPRALLLWHRRESIRRLQPGLAHRGEEGLRVEHGKMVQFEYGGCRLVASAVALGDISLDGPCTTALAPL